MLQRSKRWAKRHQTDNDIRSMTSYFLFLSLFSNSFICFPFQFDFRPIGTRVRVQSHVITIPKASQYKRCLPTCLMDHLLFPPLLLSFRDLSEGSSRQHHFLSTTLCNTVILTTRDQYPQLRGNTAYSAVFQLGSTYPSKSGPCQRATRPSITIKLEFSLC